MLRTRVITALILAPLVIGGVLFLDDELFSLILGVALLIGAWEWSHMIPLGSLPARSIYCAVIAVLMGLLWQTGLAQWLRPLLLLGLVWWLCALLWLTRPQLLSQVTPLHTSLKMLMGALVILPAWAALSMLHARAGQGPVLTLLLMLIIWLADIGAYFAGRQWGKTKLAPAISPGKTWAGVFGGMASSLLFAAIAGGLFSRSLEWTLAFMAVALVVVMFSIVGDLTVSLMKRQSGIKDSGHIIPGHGGILDRIDSLVAAAPLFLAGLLWLAL